MAIPPTPPIDTDPAPRRTYTTQDLYKEALAKIERRCKQNRKAAYHAMRTDIAKAHETYRHTMAEIEAAEAAGKRRLVELYGVGEVE